MEQRKPYDDFIEEVLNESELQMDLFKEAIMEKVTSPEEKEQVVDYFMSCASLASDLTFDTDETEEENMPEKTEKKKRRK